MGALDSFLAGNERQELVDFVNRYDQGPPYDSISGQEATRRYQQISPKLPPDVYQQSAQEAFAQMTPKQRLQLGQLVRDGAKAENVDLPDLNQEGIDDRFQDPAMLAQMIARIQQQQPGILDKLLGGGGSKRGARDNPVAKAALAGIAAMAVRKMMSGH